MRSLVLAAAAVLSIGVAGAAPADTGKCPPRPGFAMVAPEARLMMFADMKAQADTGAVDMQVLHQMQRDKMRAMTEDQRKAYFADLVKRWNALPPAKQKEVKAEAEKWRAEHPRPEGAGPHPGGHGPHGDCPPPRQ